MNLARAFRISGGDHPSMLHKTRGASRWAAAGRWRLVAALEYATGADRLCRQAERGLLRRSLASPTGRARDVDGH